MPLIRRATASDVPAIVALLADDPLGRTREDPGNPAYLSGFTAIDADPNQYLAVMQEGRAVIGTLQLTFIPGLSHTAMWRGQIESVRIAASHRGAGHGRAFFEWAIATCAARGCRVVQLTTDRTRHDAHRFYESIGFVATHHGFKRSLT